MIDTTLSSFATAQDLELDPSIRDWVVFPIIFMIMLVGIGRHYTQELLKTDPLMTEQTVNEMRFKQTLAYANIVRRNRGVLNEKAFQRRRAKLVRKADKSKEREKEKDKDTAVVSTTILDGRGLLREKVPGAANPMSNPLAMMDAMKGNVVFMVPNFVMMSFVGYFFSGFVCLKVPFPMPSTHFKLMLQRGVDLSTLDVSYVSSLSWYFLTTFGMNGIYRLILGDHADIDDMQMMSAQMGGMGMMGGNQMGFNAQAAYKQERERLALARHSWIADRIEKKMLGENYPSQMTEETIDLSKFD